MQRNVSTLSQKAYDLIVVGGGIFGVCAAWDAAQRGLSVALIEQEDFGHATSANSFKFVHSGIRYLQHADLPRIRESSRERSILLRTAPHLVHLVPVVVPTYGHGLKGKELLRAGVFLYDLLTIDRNRGLPDPARRVPRGHTLSRAACLDLFPHLDKSGLSGAVLFYEGQIYNPPRLVWCYVRSAIDAGADAANYVEATGFLQGGDRIMGVEALDRLTGNQFEIRGRVVLNAAGPWAGRLLHRRSGLHLKPAPTFSRDTCFVVPGHLLNEEYALAVQATTSDPDALLSRGRRHLFIAPWRDYTLIGVWHRVHTAPPEDVTVTDEELQGFLDEINAAYPALALTLEDVSMINAGLVLFGQNARGATDLSYGKRSRLIDHARAHGVDGVITLIGVRFTTARGVAAKTVDLACNKLGRKPLRSRTAVTRIYGGYIECFDDFLRQALERRPPAISADVMRALVRNHGSAYQDVLRYADEEPAWAETIGTSTVLKAEIVHAAREEMAQKLADAVFRRTDLGTGAHPGSAALHECADLMASELGWDDQRKRAELAEVQAAFPRFPACKTTVGIPHPTTTPPAQKLRWVERPA